MSLEALLDVPLLTNVATFFEQSWLESPATVDVVTESNWRLRGARRLSDAVTHLPSVVAYPSIWGADAFAIRGYTPTVRGVAFLLDGVPLNDFIFGTAAYYAQGNLELAGLDRIEVVRGPGSAVYGSDAFHGVLSMQSYAPSKDEAEGSAELGTDFYQRGHARASQQLAEGLRVSTVASYSMLDNQDLSYSYTDPSTGQMGTSSRDLAYQTAFGSARLRYAPEEGRVDAALGAYVIAAAADEFPSFNRAGDNSVLDKDTSKTATQFYMGRASVGVELPAKMRVDALGYGWRLDGRFQANAPSALGPVLAEYAFRRNYRAGARVMLKQDALEQAATQWLVGYELSRAGAGDDDEANFYVPISGIDPLLYRSPGAGTSRTVNSLFLSAETRLASDILRFHYGGRFDWFSDQGFVASPRLGLIAAPNDEWAFKALYGRAFRPPTGSEMYGIPLTIAVSPEVEPERIQTVELVAQVQRETFRAGLTAFSSQWRDSIRIEPVADPGPREPPAVYQNGGDNTSRGLEAAFAFARDGIRIDSGASVVRSSNDETGYEHSAFPTFTGSLGVGYRLAQVPVELYLFQRVLADMSEGAPDDTFPTSPGLSPYYQVNFHAQWEAVPKQLEVFADVRNALMRDNRVPSTFNAQGGYAVIPANASIGLRGRF